MTLDRVMLDEQHFRTLVSGGTVKYHPRGDDDCIEIRLADIGWFRMVACITEETMRARSAEPSGPPTD